MERINLTNFLNALWYLAKERVTYYDNRFPSNCGEINPDGSISFDCNNLIKSVINEPEIAYKTAPAGYYVLPGLRIPDYSEYQILENCSRITWGNFAEIVPGAYLYMDGHAGAYLGGGVVCECTTDGGGNGVKLSALDVTSGRRYIDGVEFRSWEAWGVMDKWIDYDAGNVHPEPPAGWCMYQAYDITLNQWLPVVTSGATPTDTAGLPGHPIGAIAYNSPTLQAYAVKVAGNDEFIEPYVNRMDIYDYENGYAGLMIDGVFRPVTAVAISDPAIAYRVQLVTGEWLEHVYGAQCDVNDYEYGYAGDGKNAIAQIECWVVK